VSAVQFLISGLGWMHGLVASWAREVTVALPEVSGQWPGLGKCILGLFCHFANAIENICTKS
jgi:hypothetical protein